MFPLLQRMKNKIMQNEGREQAYLLFFYFGMKIALINRGSTVCGGMHKKCGWETENESIYFK